MKEYKGLARPFRPDWQALLDNICRKGTPARVHHMELFHDLEVHEAIDKRFGLVKNMDPSHPDFVRRRYINFQRFLGFDHVSMGLSGTTQAWTLRNAPVNDPNRKSGQRFFADEHVGPITTWEEFEKYPWPNASAPEATAELEWWEKYLPQDMCIMSHTGHFCEYLTWLMGYETFCVALYDNRPLVEAIAARLLEFHTTEVKRLLQFSRVKAIWGSDDMGFRGGLLFSPEDMRKYVISGHKKLAELAHAAGRPYLLHSCGKLLDIIPDLIDDVKLDAKHSFEDTIEDVREAKKTYGRSMALLGGIDVDFLCRSDEQSIRARVRDTLEKCLPGGGYCLGSGNSVTNYIPLDNYLAMVDEGRLYG